MSNPNQANPAQKAGGTDKPARKRIPMSVPQRKLEVPEIPGYHLHWFVDANVPRAMQGGYEMVTVDEVPINQFGVGANRTEQGSADLGTHVRVVAGTAENGHPHFLNLMKIKQEYWLEDQKAIEDRNASVLSAIFKGEKIYGSEAQSGEDRGTSYVGRALFQRPTRKG